MPKHYNVVVTEPDTNDQEKTYWTKVGVAFPLKEKDGFKVLLRRNISVGGELLLLPAEDKD